MSRPEHPSELAAHLRQSGLSDDAIFRNPDAAAELSRISFLQENWLKARDELRSYVWIVAAAPITVPMFYFFHPSALMLCCSVGFALIVVVTCVTRILHRRRAMRDYMLGMERLVQIVRKAARASDETI